ncbi:MAG: type II toxin-antitoxin system VapC family toxin [Mycobacteriales bacterium]|nr:type II toxin-antitoxin system VapC family toxin [Mycobacteriales bacterium]
MALRPALLDTSVLVALESGRPVREALVPREVFVSIVTIAELRLGVLTAPPDQRALRLATLEGALALDPLPVDVEVAEAWTQLREQLRQLGRRMPMNDSWVAATALAHDLDVVTQDADYDDVPGLSVVRV